MAPSLEACKACVHLACLNLKYIFFTYTLKPSGVKVFYTYHSMHLTFNKNEIKINMNESNMFS